MPRHWVPGLRTMVSECWRADCQHEPDHPISHFDSSLDCHSQDDALAESSHSNNLWLDEALLNREASRGSGKPYGRAGRLQLSKGEAR